MSSVCVLCRLWFDALAVFNIYIQPNLKRHIVGNTGSLGEAFYMYSAETSMKGGRGGGGAGAEARVLRRQRVRMGRVSEMPSGCGV